MILGVGVDLVHVPRIVALTRRKGYDRFAKRILSASEHSDWLKLDKNQTDICTRFLAVRWGIKEAAYKAFFPAVKPTWKELTYQGHVNGTQVKPAVFYHPVDSLDSRKVGSIRASISHDGDYVLAFVVVGVPN
ncbi:4'-phosphopantetheinyl transferase [Pluteus cervinus]|uniref:4'-phosphopantetheinyl transferase n=1 Tax=Pluteus cervinus TaxID=181527 RepID=A0ACD3BDN9_9AGAR|nr:4'-phosphopantetheinyl transferase [Pluteus cervinus]